MLRLTAALCPDSNILIRSPRLWLGYLLAAALLAAATAAHAQFDVSSTDQDVGMIGGAVLNTPSYMGADSNRTRAFPFLSYSWANGWFMGVAQGIGYAWKGTPGLSFGLRLTPSPAREENDSGSLKGLGDVHMQAEFGGFAQQKLGAGFSVQSSLRYGAGNDHDGALAEAGLGWGTRLAGRTFLRAGLSANWVNQNYMQAYFGVTPTQSAASGYDEHPTRGGLRDTRASLLLLQMFSATTTGLLMVAQTRLHGDAADSPFVRDTTTTMAIAGVLYRY